jgi:hypothetical protein
MNIIETNTSRELFLTDGKNVYFIPRGWCWGWSVEKGFSGGLDFVNDDGFAKPEIYCYAPTHTVENSPVDTLFIPVTDLEKLEEVTEERAKDIHPVLFAFLDAINRGEA